MTNKEQIELENCPFCGGEAWAFTPKYPDGCTLHNIRCKRCYVAFDGYKVMDDAIKAWNTRHVKETPKTEHVSRTCTKNGENLTRDELLEALEFIASGCLVPPDGGSPCLEDAIEAAKKAIANAEQGGV